MTRLIGTGKNQVPTNSDLGGLAYQNSDRARVKRLIADEITEGTWPLIAPAYRFDFANGETIPDGLKCQRRSHGTYVGSDGFIKIADFYQPRIDYDPLTLECLGLLSEDPATNLFPNSQRLDDGVNEWNSDGITAQPATTIISPAGTLQDVWKIEKNATAGYGYYKYWSSPTNVYDGSNDINVSIFCKKAQCRYAWVYVGSGAGFGTVFIDFDNPEEPIITDGATGGAYQAKITPYKNGWYRLEATWSNSLYSLGLTGGGIGFGISDVQTTVTQAGDLYVTNVGDGAYFYGPQLEARAVQNNTDGIDGNDTASLKASSYIPTNGTQKTRLGDYCSVTIPENTLNTSEGVFFVSGQAKWRERTYPRILQGEYNGGNYLEMMLRGTYNTDIRSNGMGISHYVDAPALHTLDSPINVAYAWKSGDNVAVVNGKIESRLSTTFTTHLLDNQWFVGSRVYNGDRSLNGHVKQFYIYNKRLTDNELKTITGV